MSVKTLGALFLSLLIGAGAGAALANGLDVSKAAQPVFLLGGALLGLLLCCAILFRFRRDPAEEEYDYRVQYWMLKALVAHGTLDQEDLVCHVHDMSAAVDPTDKVIAYNGSLVRSLKVLRGHGWIAGNRDGYSITTAGRAVEQRQVAFIQRVDAELRDAEQRHVIRTTNKQQKVLKQREKRKKR